MLINPCRVCGSSKSVLLRLSTDLKEEEEKESWSGSLTCGCGVTGPIVAGFSKDITRRQAIAAWNQMNNLIPEVKPPQAFIQCSSCDYLEDCPPGMMGWRCPKCGWAWIKSWERNEAKSEPPPPPKPALEHVVKLVCSECLANVCRMTVASGLDVSTNASRCPFPGWVKAKWTEVK